MKRCLRVLAVVAMVAISAQAYGVEKIRTSVPATQILDDIAKQEFVFKDQDILHRYYSTSSCLYRSKDTVLIVHYCFPKKSYPARSFTVISAQYGIVQFYEEDVDFVVKRQITIDTFPEDYRAYVIWPTQDWLIKDWNKVYKYFEENDPIGCWSTNYSHYLKAPDSNCFNQRIEDHQAWSFDSMQLVKDADEWDKVFELVAARVQGATR